MHHGARWTRAGALLKASDLAQIKLDADVVILSACNSGGSDGSGAVAESLSALARSFFYGGARSLLITHWEVNDQAATLVVADTLRRLRRGAGPGRGGRLAEYAAEHDQARGLVAAGRVRASVLLGAVRGDRTGRGAITGRGQGCGAVIELA